MRDLAKRGRRALPLGGIGARRVTTRLMKSIRSTVSPRIRAPERSRRRSSEKLAAPPSRSTTAWTTARSAGSPCFSGGARSRRSRTTPGRPVAERGHLCHDLGLDGSPKEKAMAKGQMRNNKEAKKPKSEKPKRSVSDYKKSQGGTGQRVADARQEVLSEVDRPETSRANASSARGSGRRRLTAECCRASSRGSRASCCAASPAPATGACGLRAA